MSVAGMARSYCEEMKQSGYASVVFAGKNIGIIVMRFGFF